MTPDQMVDSVIGDGARIRLPGQRSVVIEQIADLYAASTLRILVTGSRAWTDRDAILHALDRVATEAGVAPGLVTVVHGTARGADSLADSAARQLGMRVERHPADWQLHGKSAGHRRNAEMVQLGADLTLAFPLGESRGTRGAMRLAREAGIPVRNLGDPDPSEQPGLFEAAS